MAVPVGEPNSESEYKPESDADEDIETTTHRQALHALALDAYEAEPLPDFDVFREIVSCAHRSLETAVGSEAS
jgi:hypothetical protein